MVTTTSSFTQRIMFRALFAVTIVLFVAVAGQHWLVGAQGSLAGGEEPNPLAFFTEDPWIQETLINNIPAGANVCGIFQTADNGKNRVFLRDTYPPMGMLPGCDGPTVSIVCGDGSSISGIQFGYDKDGTLIMNYDYEGVWMGQCAIINDPGGNIQLQPGIIQG